MVPRESRKVGEVEKEVGDRMRDDENEDGASLLPADPSAEVQTAALPKIDREAWGDKIYEDARALCYGLASEALKPYNQFSTRERQIIDRLAEWMGSRDCAIATMEHALKPFAFIGAFMHARPNIPDSQIVVPVEGLNNMPDCSLTRGHFKAAADAIHHQTGSGNHDTPKHSATPRRSEAP